MQIVFSLLENDIVRMIFALFVQIALSYPLQAIKHLKIRYIYSLAFGTLLQIFVYGFQALIILGFGICSYVLTKNTGHKCGGIVTFSAIALLSAYHVYGFIQKYGENKMDEVVLLMIMVCRYSLFAYAYADGHYQKKKPVNDNNETTDDQKQQKIKLSDQNKIFEDVKLMEYIGYLQFLPTSVMGPPLQYRMYDNFINSKGGFAQELPSRRSIMLQTTKQLLGCAFFYALSMFVFEPDYMLKSQFYQISSISIFFYSIISLTLLRFKYYTAWKIGILSIHSSGISLNPTHKNYTGIDHCRVIKIETTPHIRQKISSWNIMVQEWLRKCIYERCPFKSRFLAQLWVFLISAFWHGFYFGYYLSFVLWFTQVYIQTQIFRRIKNATSKFNRLYKRLGKYSFIVTILSCAIFNHNATFFYLLRSDLCLKLMQRVYFIPQLILPLGIIYMLILPKKKHHAAKKVQHQHRA